MGTIDCKKIKVEILVEICCRISWAPKVFLQNVYAGEKNTYQILHKRMNQASLDAQ